MAAQPTTSADALQKILSDIAQYQALPDADIQFAIGIQAAIVSKLRSNFGPPPGQGGAPPMGGPPQGMQRPMGPGTAAGPGIPGGLGGGAPTMGGMPGPAGVQPGQAQLPPNPDELRRLLQSQAGA